MVARLEACCVVFGNNLSVRGVDVEKVALMHPPGHLQTDYHVITRVSM